MKKWLAVYVHSDYLSDNQARAVKACNAISEHASNVLEIVSPDAWNHRYVRHDGEIVFSQLQMGCFPEHYDLEKKFPNCNSLVLMGGQVGRCHLQAFKCLIESDNIENIVIPRDTVFFWEGNKLYGPDNPAEEKQKYSSALMEFSRSFRRFDSGELKERACYFLYEKKQKYLNLHWVPSIFDALDLLEE
jgi:hypothetical protein